MTRDKAYPEARALLEAGEAEGNPPLESLAPAEARQAAIDALKPYAGSPEPLANVEDFTIPQPEHPIPVRIYSPAATSSRPALVYFHGGGWILCDLNTHDVVSSAIAHRAGAVVVAVDYRLSPEHKFPAAVDDCFAAVEWVAANTSRLGVDPNAIAVGGDSAGGNLSAVMYASNLATRAVRRSRCRRWSIQ